MPGTVKLGCRPARNDPRTLRLASYLPKELLPAPDAVNWFGDASVPFDFGMMGNDLIGDCVFAGGFHALQIWYGATGSPLTFPDSTVIDYYSRWAGYVPGDPDTDQGFVELDFLNLWRKNGLAGEGLVAYADPDPRNIEHVKQAIWRFGLTYDGIALPLTAQDQEVWDYVPNKRGNQPGSWGLHCVITPHYYDDGKMFECLTWGKKQKYTQAFRNHYFVESHALLASVWKDRATSDFNLPDLTSDLGAVTS